MPRPRCRPRPRVRRHAEHDAAPTLDLDRGDRQATVPDARRSGRPPAEVGQRAPSCRYRVRAARRSSAPPASVERRPSAASGAAATPPAASPNLNARANGPRCAGELGSGHRRLLGQLPEPRPRLDPGGQRRRNDRARGGADISLATAGVEAGDLLDADQHGSHPCFTEDPTAPEDQHVRRVERRL